MPADLKEFMDWRHYFVIHKSSSCIYWGTSSLKPHDERGGSFSATWKLRCLCIASGSVILSQYCTQNLPGCHVFGERLDACSTWAS